MAHPIDCTSCPHCNPEMAAIMRDSIAGREESLTRRMDAITLRTLRALGAKSTHPAYRALRMRALKSPTTEDFVSALASFRNDKHNRNIATSRLTALLNVTPAPIAASRPVMPSVGTVPAAPDLTAAIRAARKE